MSVVVAMAIGHSLLAGCGESASGVLGRTHGVGDCPGASDRSLAWSDWVDREVVRLLDLPDRDGGGLQSLRVEGSNGAVTNPLVQLSEQQLRGLDRLSGNLYAIGVPRPHWLVGVEGGDVTFVGVCSEWERSVLERVAELHGPSPAEVFVDAVASTDPDRFRELTVVAGDELFHEHAREQLDFLLPRLGPFVDAPTRVEIDRLVESRDLLDAIDLLARAIIEMQTPLPLELHTPVIVLLRNSHAPSELQRAISENPPPLPSEG